MKNHLKILIVFVSVAIAFYACSSDDSSNNNGNGGTTNEAPSSITVSVNSIAETTATLNWTEATDPDGDTVTYSITLQDSEIATELSLLTLDLTGLTPFTSYSGTVVAKDGNGGNSTANFSFSTNGSAPALHQAFLEFDADNTDIMLSGSNVMIETNGLPNHTSPYWSNTTERTAIDPMGNTLVTPASAVNHPLFVEPTVTTYMFMAPGNIDDFNGSYSLTVSANPQLAANSTATGLGAIGIAVSGSMIYNDEEGPNIPLDNAVSSLDYTAAHTGPQSYHYHLETKAWSDDDEKLIGIIADGFFIYGRKCNSTNDYPTDLDASGGHTSTTQHSDGASEYHYHIQNELYLNQYYILFPGDYQGTPSNIQ
ncbi:fibronectin type III domain-containing protein [Psychroserpens ponticola]|uniref:YHYH protein n=1 Tax=Psychroserpens ponticola TaxID=2932268 RepID=A0ABY7RUP7_9FLAO|nr:YHYH protein [Psychroserpens ponticola]WCO00649.1 YHYH protein [Psychroserpens ponticola]